jgi:hypothetical protein
MKKLILPLLALIILSSCSSDDDNAPQVIEPLVITKADCETHYSPGGEAFTVFATSASNVTIPVPGEDQVWDFSVLDELGSTLVGGSDFINPSDPAFPTATYAEEISGFYFISGVESNDYDGFRFYELNDDGLFGLGLAQNQSAVLNVQTIGAVINYEAQTRPHTGTSKLPSVLFPAEFGDSAITTYGIEDTSSFTVNAPAFGLNNTPGKTVNTYDVTQEVIASGTANFKGIGEKRVLVTKSVTTTTINYFLGGAPAPAALLSMLGVTDGDTSTETTYRFIAEDLGSAGFIDVDDTGTITGARFRKQ